jgi:hypothetical protein
VLLGGVQVLGKEKWHVKLSFMMHNKPKKTIENVGSNSFFYLPPKEGVF